MAFSEKVLAGPGHIILNIIRAMNLICFLTVVAACIVMMTKMIMLAEFYFFDFAGHLITAFVSIFLFVSELDIFRSYFEKQWPLLSLSHGLVLLGLVMMALGVNVLGCLSNTDYSQQSLGLQFWQLVMAAGCLLISLGFLNVVASFTFSNPATNTTARQVRSKRAAPANMYPSASNTNLYNVSGDKAADDMSGTTVNAPKTKRFSLNFSKLVAQLGGTSGNTSQPPALPSYRNSPVPSSHYSERISMDSNAAGFKIWQNPHLVDSSRPVSVAH